MQHRGARLSALVCAAVHGSYGSEEALPPFSPPSSPPPPPRPPPPHAPPPLPPPPAWDRALPPLIAGVVLVAVALAGLIAWLVQPRRRSRLLGR